MSNTNVIDKLYNFITQIKSYNISEYKASGKKIEPILMNNKDIKPRIWFFFWSQHMNVLQAKCFIKTFISHRTKPI